MTHTTAEGTRAPARATELEDRLGDPLLPDNPVGHAAILRADERAEVVGAAERVLDEFGLNAEFVPPAHGGRLARLDHLLGVLRAVYRRDPALGTGYGIASLIAGVNVWTAGSDAQAAAAANLLLGNKRIAAAYTELAHGSDVIRNEFAATPGPDGLVLHGRKEVVTNLERAEALVLFARTDPAPGNRSHSQVFVDKSALPDGRMRYLPRFHSVGMRGVELGGAEFDDYPVPPENVLGPLGHGVETLMRSFQITRTTIPGVLIGALDSGLRATLRHVLSRELYGRRVFDLPYIRSVLAGAFADLLVCDSIATVAARGIHLVPAEASVLAAAVKLFVPRRLNEAMHRLSVVLGAQFYLRDGEHAIFQKLVRDLRSITFSHASRAACQQTLLPQLPLLAKRSWRQQATAPAALFRLGDELPPLPFGELAVSARGRDRITPGMLAELAALSEQDTADAEVGRAAAPFADELAVLADECAALPPGEQTVSAGSRSYELPGRYAGVLAAACCLQVWRHQAGDRFLGDHRWLLAALGRLRAPVGKPHTPLPAELEQWLCAELLDRHAGARTFDLAERPLPDGSGRTWQQPIP